MTFKHIKFEDSVTMRSLEKVATEKGLVQPEAIAKTANKRSDYSVTNNLTENIIKLCAGLRDHGLVKYADELESKFMDYKKATAHYNTSKEEGKDLVDAAHPHGSHKLEGVEGDSLIETIIDQQMKDLEIVNKKPSGKLSKAEAINKIKIVLAQESDQALNSIKIILDSLNAISQFYHHEAQALLFTSPSDLLEFVKSIKYPTTIDFSKIYIDAGKLYHSYKPNVLGIGLSSATWAEMEPLFNKIFKAVKEGKDFINTPKERPLDPTIKLFIDTIINMRRKISKYKAIIKAKNPEKMSELLGYLDKVSNYVEIMAQNFNEIGEGPEFIDTKIAVSKTNLDRLNAEIMPGFHAFEGTYVTV